MKRELEKKAKAQLETDCERWKCGRHTLIQVNYNARDFLVIFHGKVATRVAVLHVEQKTESAEYQTYVTKAKSVFLKVDTAITEVSQDCSISLWSHCPGTKRLL